LILAPVDCAVGPNPLRHPFIVLSGDAVLHLFELIPYTTDSNNNFWFRRLNFHFFAQTTDTDIDQIRFTNVLVAPDFTEEHFAGKHLTGISSQKNTEVQTPSVST
jgi:hypothetical protein